MRSKAGFSPSTVTLGAKVIRTALNRACRQRLIPTNPAKAVDLPGNDSVKAILRKAGVDSQPVKRSVGVRTLSRRTFHELCHSFTRALADAGVAPEL